MIWFADGLLRLLHCCSICCVYQWYGLAADTRLRSDTGFCARYVHRAGGLSRATTKGNEATRCYRIAFDCGGLICRRCIIVVITLLNYLVLRLAVSFLLKLQEGILAVGGLGVALIWNTGRIRRLRNDMVTRILVLDSIDSWLCQRAFYFSSLMLDLLLWICVIADTIIQGVLINSQFLYWVRSYRAGSSIITGGVR